MVVAEGKVSSIDADEGVGEDEDHQERDAEEDHDEEKVWLLGRALLDFHEQLDAGYRRWVRAGYDYWLGG